MNSKSKYFLKFWTDFLPFQKSEFRNFNNGDGDDKLVMMMINWSDLRGFPIPKASTPDPSHWGDRNKNILDLWEVLYSLKILGYGGD